MKDFFISYNKADRPYAEWIAWQLKAAGYSVVIQAWDFREGSNFVLEMQRAIEDSARTLAVLSPDFLASRFTAPEWAAAFAADPAGQARKLVPVRVRECTPSGLLAQICYIDLVGLKTEDAARERLLQGLAPSGAPDVPPPLPDVPPPLFKLEPPATSRRHAPPWPPALNWCADATKFFAWSACRISATLILTYVIVGNLLQSALPDAAQRASRITDATAFAAGLLFVIFIEVGLMLKRMRTRSAQHPQGPPHDSGTS